jgi:hypothetical protein
MLCGCPARKRPSFAHNLAESADWIGEAALKDVSGLTLPSRRPVQISYRSNCAGPPVFAKFACPCPNAKLAFSQLEVGITAIRRCAQEHNKWM